MQSNDLVAEDVAARCKGRGDGDVPLQVVAHQLVRRPGLRAGRQALLRDLEEAKVGGLGRGAAAGALGQGVDDGALVAVARPGVPGNGNGRAGGDGDLGGAGGGGLVAGDVRGAEGVRRDEADVLVEREPARLLRLGGGVVPDLWMLVLMVQKIRNGSAYRVVDCRVGDAIGHNVGHEAVGVSEGGERSSAEE